jgi:hypothetical protein
LQQNKTWSPRLRNCGSDAELGYKDFQLAATNPRDDSHDADADGDGIWQKRWGTVSSLFPTRHIRLERGLCICLLSVCLKSDQLAEIGKRRRWRSARRRIGGEAEAKEVLQKDSQKTDTGSNS